MALDAILARATAKSPVDRFDSCGEFAAAVRQVFDAAPLRPVATRQDLPTRTATAVADAAPPRRRLVDAGPVRPPVVKGKPGWVAMTERRPVDEPQLRVPLPMPRARRLQPRQLLILFYVSLLVILCILVFTDITNW